MKLFLIYFSVVIILNYFGPKFIFELFYKFVDINDIMVLFLDCDTGLAEMDNIIKIMFNLGNIIYTKQNVCIYFPLI